MGNDLIGSTTLSFDDFNNTSKKLTKNMEEQIWKETSFEFKKPRISTFTIYQDLVLLGSYYGIYLLKPGMKEPVIILETNG